jgi:hypothetical protein
MNRDGPSENPKQLKSSPDKEPCGAGRSISLSDHAAACKAAGRRTFAGSSGTWWLQHELGSMVRFPIFALNRPPARELRCLYWIHLSPVVSYLLEPSETMRADALVYLCTDPQYSLGGLERNVQGNVKRGLREFQIRFFNSDELRQCGAKAYIDTWRRHGRENVGPKEFRKDFCALAHLPGHKFIGAWKDNELAAFADLIEVDDWVEVRSRFSTETHLGLRPNDALLFYILSHYLRERGFRTVSAGTSSVDPAANTPGLHRFKVKMGFRAIPVCRIFSFHPLIRPFVGRASLGLLGAITKKFPNNRRLLLAEHALKHVLYAQENPLSFAGIELSEDAHS